ncbi:hypothetical protein LXL04_007771 [Taraxacum kok-saghyz]
MERKKEYQKEIDHLQQLIAFRLHHEIVTQIVWKDLQNERRRALGKPNANSRFNGGNGSGVEINRKMKDEGPLQHRDMVVIAAYILLVAPDLYACDVACGSPFQKLKKLKLRLPTRVLLHRREVSMDSVLCPMCNEEEEMVHHVFGTCEVTRALWRLVFMWMQLQGVDVTGAESVFEWVDVVKVSLAKKKVMKMMICTTLWFLWRLRNDIVHDSWLIRRNIYECGNKTINSKSSISVYNHAVAFPLLEAVPATKREIGGKHEA